jgi:hypothetical protein
MAHPPAFPSPTGSPRQTLRLLKTFINAENTPPQVLM